MFFPSTAQSCILLVAFISAFISASTYHILLVILPSALPPLLPPPSPASAALPSSATALNPSLIPLQLPPPLPPLGWVWQWRSNSTEDYSLYWTSQPQPPPLHAFCLLCFLQDAMWLPAACSVLSRDCPSLSCTCISPPCSASCAIRFEIRRAIANCILFESCFRIAQERRLGRAGRR